jgi:hypothetical protein
MRGTRLRNDRRPKCEPLAATQMLRAHRRRDQAKWATSVGCWVMPPSWMTDICGTCSTSHPDRRNRRHQSTSAESRKNRHAGLPRTPPAPRPRLPATRRHRPPLTALLCRPQRSPPPLPFSFSFFCPLFLDPPHLPNPPLLSTTSLPSCLGPDPAHEPHGAGAGSGPKQATNLSVGGTTAPLTPGFPIRGPVRG